MWQVSASRKSERMYCVCRKTDRIQKDKKKEGRLKICSRRLHNKNRFGKEVYYSEYWLDKPE